MPALAIVTVCCSITCMCKLISKQSQRLLLCKRATQLSTCTHLNWPDLVLTHYRFFHMAVQWPCSCYRLTLIPEGASVVDSMTALARADLMDRHAVNVAHLVKLVNADHATICKHHGARLQAPLPCNKSACMSKQTKHRSRDAVGLNTGSSPIISQAHGMLQCQYPSPSCCHRDRSAPCKG